MKYRFFLCLSLFYFWNTYTYNITVVGVGRLGLCVALCLEKMGHSVLGVDVSAEYIASLNNKTLNSAEPYVNDYLKESSNFRATTSLQEGLDFADIYFITVSTTVHTDAYNFDALTELLQKINTHKVQNKNIVLLSTVTPGYIKNNALPALNNCTVTFSYNPPFIAQGDIIQGYRNPDMVLIGQGSKEIGDVLENLYVEMCSSKPYIARMNVESAEITKLALNCYITMKIAYANFVGDIADETPYADKNIILKAIGADSRIGSKYFKAGYGFGGPCFPRDNRALAGYAKDKQLQPLLFEATDQSNMLHAHVMAQKIMEPHLLSDKKSPAVYMFTDVSYKENSPVKIIQESQKLVVASIIAQQGNRVIIKDTQEVIDLVQKKYGSLFSYDPIEG